MQYYPFDSRNPIYRSKFGALSDNDVLKLRILLHRDACCYDAFLCYRKDGEQGTTEIPLAPREWLEDYRFYDCELKLNEGLYWYYFRYTSAHGEFFITKLEDSSLGVVSDNYDFCWQQTVCLSDFKTPDWLAGGIIYQIFPDRFFSSKKAKDAVPDDRFLCKTWSKTPEHRQGSSPLRLSNDYYGGDLEGIRQRLPYIKNLGVNCIYLNPIFEAHSNHRYNTADYFKIDPLLGDEDDFKKLCRDAKKIGIRIILDGVFSHTGDDSRYFNRYGRYPDIGAYNSPDSRYKAWYHFNEYPDDYTAWWGIKTLPETDETNADFCEFITGENGVLRYWMKLGADGWRLDVADELPDSFLDKVRDAVKTENPDGFILGEVWEDASNKISYGVRRRYLRGRQLDSVMNYPFSDAIIEYVRGGNARSLADTVLSILENYPAEAVKLLMNHLGTHDTARILTRISPSFVQNSDREWQAGQILSSEEYKYAVELLKLAALIQYTLPGVPSLYYGDEAGMQGYGDPFCRAAFPLGREDTALTEYYKLIGKIRRENPCFMDGEFSLNLADKNLLVFERKGKTESILIALNAGNYSTRLDLPCDYTQYELLLGVSPDKNGLCLPPVSFSVLKKLQGTTLE